MEAIPSGSTMPSAKPQIWLVADVGDLSRAAAVEFVRRAREAGQARGVFTIAPAGGSTPKSVCALLGLPGETEKFWAVAPSAHITGGVSLI